MPKLPEIVNRYPPTPADMVTAGTTEYVGQPVTLEVPPGSVAVVAMFARLLSAYDIPGLGHALGIDLRATLSDEGDSGGNERPLQLTGSSEEFSYLSKTGPVAVVVQPGGSKLTWRVWSRDPSLLVFNYPDAQISLSLRAVLVDASTPHGELLKLLGAGLS
jgi:hypothetical protein